MTALANDLDAVGYNADGPTAQAIRALLETGAPGAGEIAS